MTIPQDIERWLNQLPVAELDALLVSMGGFAGVWTANLEARQNLSRVLRGVTGAVRARHENLAARDELTKALQTWI